MKYKGYIGFIAYDEDDKMFYGEVIGINDIITYQGATVDELEQDFKDAVDYYIEWCREDGVEPQICNPGALELSMANSLRIRLESEAAMKQISLNELILSKLNS